MYILEFQYRSIVLLLYLIVSVFIPKNPHFNYWYLLSPNRSFMTIYVLI